MKQQAIDILKDEIKVQEEMGNNYFISVLKFLIEKMESLGDGWIEVTERLPEKGNIVVFFNSNNGSLNAGKVMECDIRKGTLSPPYTHWMPLPNPPKQ